MTLEVWCTKCVHGRGVPQPTCPLSNPGAPQECTGGPWCTESRWCWGRDGGAFHAHPRCQAGREGSLAGGEEEVLPPGPPQAPASRPGPHMSWAAMRRRVGCRVLLAGAALRSLPQPFPPAFGGGVPGTLCPWGAAETFPGETPRGCWRELTWPGAGGGLPHGPCSHARSQGPEPAHPTLRLPSTLCGLWASLACGLRQHRVEPQLRTVRPGCRRVTVNRADPAVPRGQAPGQVWGWVSARVSG